MDSKIYDIQDDDDAQWEYFEKILTAAEKTRDETGQMITFFRCPRCGCSEARIAFYENSEFNGGCPNCDFQFRTQNVGNYNEY